MKNRIKYIIQAQMNKNNRKVLNIDEIIDLICNNSQIKYLIKQMIETENNLYDIQRYIEYNNISLNKDDITTILYLYEKNLSHNKEWENILKETITDYCLFKERKKVKTKTKEEKEK